MPRATTRTHAHVREHGFSVIEMMIALLVIAILIAVVAMGFGGAKKATYAQEGKTVGSAYMQAVSQYHADFANRHPPTTGPPTQRWSGNNAPDTQRGPLNLTGAPYMKSVPDAVSSGRVGVSVNTNCGAPGPPTGATTQTAWVSVCYLAEPRFWVRVISRKNSGDVWSGPSATACYMGAPASPPSYKTC